MFKLYESLIMFQIPLLYSTTLSKKERCRPRAVNSWGWSIRSYPRHQWNRKWCHVCTAYGGKSPCPTGDWCQGTILVEPKKRIAKKWMSSEILVKILATNVRLIVEHSWRHHTEDSSHSLFSFHLYLATWTIHLKDNYNVLRIRRNHLIYLFIINIS